MVKDASSKYLILLILYVEIAKMRKPLQRPLSYEII